VNPNIARSRWTLIVALLIVGAPVSGASAQPPAELTPVLPTDPNAPADHKSWYSASYSVTLVSRYLFQGLDYSAGKASLQPEIDLTMGPLTAKAWANHDLERGISDEFDFSLEHGWSAGKVSGSTGYTHLHYPHRDGWEPSQEFYASVTRDAAVSATVSVHYDFDAGTGTYSVLGLSRSVERPFGTVTVGGNLFHQSGYYDATGIPAAELNLNLSRSIGNVSVTPSVSRFLTWENGDFRGAEAVGDAWVFSLSLAQEF
jgi:hypothetical protein